MRSLLDRTKEISCRFRGLKATRCFFPEVYAELKPTLILNDDAICEIDLRLVELLHKHCFPCYDPHYDYTKQTREEPYWGLEKISIIPMSFNSYDCYYQDWGNSFCYVQMVSDEYFDYYGYDYSSLSRIEEKVQAFANSHPIQILPDVVAYVWAMTGNLWLDSSEEASNEFDLVETEIVYLETEYKQALEMVERLLFFENWFVDNYAVAHRLVNLIIQKTNDLRTNSAS